MFKSAVQNKNVFKDNNDNGVLRFVPSQNLAVKHNVSALKYSCRHLNLHRPEEQKPDLMCG